MSQIAFYFLLALFALHAGIVSLLSVYIHLKLKDRNPETLSADYRMHQIQAPPTIIVSCVFFVLVAAGLFALSPLGHVHRSVFLFVMYLWWGYRIVKARSEAKDCLVLDSEIKSLKSIRKKLDA